MTEKVKQLPKKWDVFNMEHIYEMLHFLSAHHGGDCSKCKTTCCANQMLEVQSEEVKTLAKHLKMQPIDFRFKYTKTKDNFYKDLKVKEMSERAKEIRTQAGRVLMFTESDDKIKIGGYETGATYCPFYNKETHRCTVHIVRPMACREYPFLRLDDNIFEIRKIPDCLISSKFLEKLIEYMSTIDIAKPMIDKIKKDIESKKYFNHYYLPWPVVLIYMGKEFFLLGPDGMKLSMDIIKRLEAEKKFIEKKAEIKNIRKR